MTKLQKVFLTAVALSLFLAAVLWVTPFFKGVSPAVLPPAGDLANDLPPAVGVPAAVNLTGLPLSLPQGFEISVVAKDLPGARVLIWDGKGGLLVSQTGPGKISRIDLASGKIETFLSGLRRPHGMAIWKNELYFAEETSLSKVALEGGKPQKIVSLPKGARHFTRSIQFGHEGRLYISIGSTCDVCLEDDPRHAAVYSLDLDSGDFSPVAVGLRNAVFLTMGPDGRLWATEMGRDNLGDDLPPDEINAVDVNPPPSQPQDFGWPYCYGQNVADLEFGPGRDSGNDRCRGKIPARADLPAHSAPLGLAFVPENSSWPAAYRGNLLVAYHGSWNRRDPTGYKIVRLKFDDDGNYSGAEDFVSGWLSGTRSLGRPAGLLFSPDGSLYASDDKSGLVYRISYLPRGSAAGPRIFGLTPGQEVSSPLEVAGEAPGTWYFEGSFPVVLLDESGRQLAAAPAQAKTDWMTEDFVAFSTQLRFQAVAGSAGTLVLRKDNPSGLPQFDAEYRMPVFFK